MSGPASEYAAIVQQAEQLIADEIGPAPCVRAYMLARASLLYIARVKGGQHAADLAYDLCQEVMPL